MQRNHYARLSSRLSDTQIAQKRAYTYFTENVMASGPLIAAALTGAAASVIAALAASLPATPAYRIAFAAALSAWFVAALALGAMGVVRPDGLGTPGVGLAVALPILAGVYLCVRRQPLRAALLGIPTAILIGANAPRVLGVFFLILYAQDRLPGPFAPSAGWGDVAVGLTALPVAILVARKLSRWRPLALAWNTFALADLVVAVGLGVASAADFPLSLFTAGPDSGLMSGLPMFLIPGFLVPLWMLVHLAVFYQLLRPAKATLHTVPT